MMITFSNVSKIYEDGTKAINSLNFTINQGEFFVLIGPSGCGKTTTMKMINRLIEPTDGAILIRDKEINSYNIHELRWNIGYVLQQIALFPHMTIAENIAIVPEMRKWDSEKIDKRIDKLLEMVGLDPTTYRDRLPSELSGGQQQRIGVIRALAGDPEIILMDEPFSALDPISREQLQHDIQRLQQEIKKTIVFVTHDMDEAIALGDRICLMKDGEVVQIDTPQNLINNPKNKFVKQFIGNRKSDWMETVGDIMERGYIPTSPKEYAEVPTLKIPFDSTLREALQLIHDSEQSELPVIKGMKGLGTLSYKDILFYLDEKNKEQEVNV